MLFFTPQAVECDYERRLVPPPPPVRSTAAQNPQEGFLQGDGSLTIRLRVRLLFLVLHIYTTADLAAHRGFGVVNVQADQKPEHYSHGCGGTAAAAADGGPPGGSAAGSPPADEERMGDGRGMGGEDVGGGDDGEKSKKKCPTTRCDGSLPCLTLEVLQCTSLEELEKMVARVLGDDVESPDIRLWVITQPVTDAPLAPRELLRCVYEQEFLDVAVVLTCSYNDFDLRLFRWL